MSAAEPTVTLRTYDHAEGEFKYRDKPLAHWLLDIVPPTIEAKAEHTSTVLITLITNLVEKGLLTVKEVVDMLGEDDVFPAGEAPPT